MTWNFSPAIMLKYLQPKVRFSPKGQVALGFPWKLKQKNTLWGRRMFQHLGAQLVD